MTDLQVAEIYAKSLGFVSGKDAGYSTLGLWLNPSGSIHVYPAKEGWTVAFFAPNASVPYSSKYFQECKQAFAYAGRDH